MTNDQQTRIIGGVPANYLHFPWQATIYFRMKHICGGSLINDLYVLTAANCFDDIQPNKSDRVTVRLLAPTINATNRNTVERKVNNKILSTIS